MEVSWLSAILVGAGYLAFGYFIGSRYPPRFLRFSFSKYKDSSLLNDNNNNNNSSSKQKKSTKSKLKEPLEVEKLADILDDFKMVIPLNVIFFFFYNPPTLFYCVASKIVPFYADTCC